MSRLGKLPIKLPAGVQVTINDKEIVFKGPKGELKIAANPVVEVKVENNELIIAPYDRAAKNASAMWGLVWSLARNSVIGVTEGFTKKLEINGVGYRATAVPGQINMALGFSHPVEFKLPVGITAVVEGNTITLSGSDKAIVGETAAQIRRIRKPEPYKGKGIKYSDEVIRRKAGKAASKGK
jgi:large subunit ribosomal protein L6